MKKIMIVILSVFILLNMIVVSAFGVEYNDIDISSDQEMYDVLSAYNIFRGYDTGEFKYEKELTRGELAKVLSMLTGYMKYSNIVTTSFSDVKGNWAEKYIAIAESIGISKGYSDGSFRPDDLVAYEDAITMLLRTMGYQDGNMIGNYPDNYMNLANELGILARADDSAVNMTRGNMAKIVYSALSKNLVEYREGEFLSKDKTLFDNLGMSDRIEISPNFVFEHKEYDFSEFIGNTCDVYFDTNDNVVLVRNPKYEVEKGIVKTVMDNNTMFIRENYGDIVMKNIDIENVIYNYSLSYIDIAKYEGSEIVMLKEDSIVKKVILNKSEDEIIVKYNDIYKGLLNMIQSTLDEKIIEQMYGKASSFLTEDDLRDTYIRIYGDAETFEDIEENDYIKYYPSSSNDNKYLGIKVIRNRIEGKFNGYKVLDYIDYVSIDYKLYKIKNKPNEVLVEGDELTAIMNEDNEIIKMFVRNYVSKPTNLALISNIRSRGNELPIVELIDNRGRKYSFVLNEYSGEVYYKLNLDGSRLYYTSLIAGDYVYFTAFDENYIKKIEKVDAIDISGKLSGNKIKIDNYSFTADSCVLNEDKVKISSDEMFDIIEGNAVVDADDNILMAILNINKKIPKVIEASEIVEAKPVDENNSDGLDNSSDADNEVKKDDNREETNTSVKQIEGLINFDKTSKEKLFLYNMDGYFKLDEDMDLMSYKNKFVLINSDNGVLLSMKAYEADGSDSKVTKLYENQAQLFGFSYIEFNANLDIYIASKNASGDFVSFIKGSKEDLAIGDTINYYDTHGSYDGVIDVIIIIK